MGLRGRTIPALGQTANEPQRPATTGVTQAPRHGCKFLHRAVSVAKQLLDDRGVVFATENGGEIKGKPRRAGDVDAIATPSRVAWSNRGCLVQHNTCQRIEVDSVWDGKANRLGRRHSAQTEKSAPSRPGDEASAMSEAQPGATALQRSWCRLDPKDRLVYRYEQLGLDETQSCSAAHASAVELCRRDVPMLGPQQRKCARCEIRH